KILTIVEEGLQQDIPGRFSRDDALFICRERLLERALKMGAREADLVRSALDLPGAVVVPGGGWGAVPGRLGALPRGVLSVWLRVSPEAALERAAGQGDTRPLLRGPGPALERARELLSARLPAYRAAALHLDTEGRLPLEIADEISEILRRSDTPPRPSIE
ncbi:MAG: shikimate kinase, partial [Longimicrobiales bacterium]|nr:shikimate kinase [Longimicrobiales bacterium]